MPRKKVQPGTGTQAGPRKTVAEAMILPSVCGQIRMYREKSGLGQAEFARRIRVRQSAVSNWETGRSRPDLNLLPAICDALGITLEALFGIPANAQSITPEETGFLESFRQLNQGHRNAVLTLMHALRESQIPDVQREIMVLPLVERAAAAGTGDPGDFDGRTVPMYVHATADTRRADLIFAVNGESMEPEYHDGDLILVQRAGKGLPLRYGETAVFMNGNEVYVKVYREDGLYSLNPAFAPMRFTDQDAVYMIGRVTGKLADEELASREEIRRYRENGR